MNRALTSSPNSVPEIFRCTLLNLEEIIQVSRKTFTETFSSINSAENINLFLNTAYSFAAIEKEISALHSAFYLARTENKTSGYLKLNFNEAQIEFKETEGMELERIYILEEYKGTGLAQQLMDFTIDRGRKSEKKYIWLGVWEHNLRAIRFYEKYGFRKIGQHPFLLGNDMQTDILMRLEL